MTTETDRNYLINELILELTHRARLVKIVVFLRNRNHHFKTYLFCLPMLFGSELKKETKLKKKINP